MDELSQEVIIIAFLSLFILVVTVAIINMILLYQKRQMKFIKEKEKMTALHANQLLQTQLEIQEQTFRNVSQEIHDNIGQVLSLVKLNINTMDYSAPDALQEKIKDSKQLITKALQDLRDLSRSMNTDYLIETDLQDAIAYQVEMVKKSKHCQVNLTTQGSPYRLEDQQQLILIRIVQEALHNIIKHAEASSIEIIIQFSADSFFLQIVDNGKGFEINDGQKNDVSGGGLGIRNMKSRAKLIRADMDIKSTPGQGTTISVLLPSSQIKI